MKIFVTIEIYPSRKSQFEFLYLFCALYTPIFYTLCLYCLSIHVLYRPADGTKTIGYYHSVITKAINVSISI